MSTHRTIHHLVRFLCIALWGVTASLHAQTAIQPFSASAVVDLTHVMHDDMAFWPGGVPFTKTELVTYDSGGYLLHKFSMGENTGTHVDAPAHFIAGKKSIEQLAVEQLIVPMVVIDARTEVQREADYQLSVADLIAWEAEHGRIPAQSLVVMNSGWHARFDTPQQYINMDETQVMHFPGYAADAARFLVKRQVAGIGIDTLSLDYGGSTTFPTHGVMLAANKYQVENMANLDALPATGAIAVIGVLPVRAGSQAQARIFALLP